MTTVATINSVTIHRLNSGFANVADSFSLDADDVDEYRGDSSAEYELPEGFRIAMSRGGTREVYDAAGHHYALASWSLESGVCLVSADRTIRFNSLRAAR